MMTSHVKLRKEKGSLAEYESQMKGESFLLFLSLYNISTAACLFIYTTAVTLLWPDCFLSSQIHRSTSVYFSKTNLISQCGKRSDSMCVRVCVCASVCT